MIVQIHFTVITNQIIVKLCNQDAGSCTFLTSLIDKLTNIAAAEVFPDPFRSYCLFLPLYLH